VWNQIKADVLGCDYCTIDREDIALLGQALVAAGATGHLRDVRARVRDLVHVERVYHPREAATALYRERIAEYAILLDRDADMQYHDRVPDV
jgi:sugar (pentulose or hexulose) kinase